MTSPRTRTKGELTAERILDAAEELFSERGYAGATLRDVAARVDLRVPSLYNHFESKDALYAAVLERGIRPVMEVLTEFMDPSSPSYHDADRTIARALDLLANRPALPRLIQHETLSGGERLTPMLRERIAPVFSRARAMVEESAAASHWDTDLVPLLVLAMYHIVAGYFTIAPFYKALSAEDLLNDEALERQLRFFRELVAKLFPEEPAQT